MPGKPRNFASAMVELGPGDVWINTELPATGSRPTLAAAPDGVLTPDSVASPNAIHLGYTQEGGKALYKPNIQNFEADESTVPVISSLAGEPSNLQGNWWQVLDMITLQKMMVGSNYSTGTGFSQNTFGGKQTIAAAPVMLIAPLYADPTKVFVFMLYKAFNAAGFEIGISRKAVASSPFDFQAMEIGTRPQGDRVGIVYTTS
jgi:hypothetical protein